MLWPEKPKRGGLGRLDKKKEYGGRSVYKAQITRENKTRISPFNKREISLKKRGEKRDPIYGNGGGKRGIKRSQGESC